MTPSFALAFSAGFTSQGINHFCSNTHWPAGSEGRNIYIKTLYGFSAFLSASFSHPLSSWVHRSQRGTFPLQLCHRGEVGILLLCYDRLSGFRGDVEESDILLGPAFDSTGVLWEGSLRI